MKIILVHSSQFTDQKTPWLYFGSSYLKTKLCERRLSEKRINLQDEIHLQAEVQKIPFLKWIEAQRVVNKDSIFWWMTHIAGKNNAYSNFYLNLCQLFAIKNYLNKNNQEKEILIICEDAFLLKLLSQNLLPEFKLKLPFLFRYYWYKDILQLLVKGLISQFKLIFVLAIHYIYAQLTAPKKKIKPQGDVSLFHHCLDKTDTWQDSIITCKYFTILPRWLTKQGVKVFGLPWLFNSRPSKNFYKKLRKANCLIPEDWLNLRDYFYIFKSYIKSLKTLNYDILYPDVKFNCLIFRERLFQFGEQSAFFWRYIPAIQKWSEKLNSITTYDRYENGITEHPIRYIIKKLPIKSTTIGYYHSLVSKEFMIYQYLESEWGSKMKPDFVACSGKIGENQLINQGVPQKKILQTAALRQSIAAIELSKKKPINRLLILLPMDVEESIEILMKTYSNNLLITDELKLKVRVKNHPKLEGEHILKKIKWKNLPQGWEWATKNLYSELEDSYCCIAMGTASVFDVILAGNIVISCMSDLKIMDNYLDFFSEKYSLIHSVSEKELPTKLKEIFVTKTQQYQDEFYQIRQEIFKGVNPINSKNLSNFLV